MTFRELNTSSKGTVGFFAPRTWAFWRALVTSFCACSLIGHWLEFPYCAAMNRLFGIVSDDYALYHDPWFHPYWVYGVGAVGMTLVLEPVKGWVAKRRKTMGGAVAETYAVAVILSMVMELGIGLLVNQPDENGIYPYWDNSQLPGNIAGQAWIVNDVFIGLIAMVYLWLLSPLVFKGYERLGSRRANVVFAALLVAFCVCCMLSYTILIKEGFLSL